MGLLRKNGTGSYKLIFRTYNPVTIGRKIEMGLGTKHPDEARYRAMIVLRALCLAGLAANPSLNVAVIASDGEDGERICSVTQDWVEQQLHSCRRQALAQVRNEYIAGMESRIKTLYNQNHHLRERLAITQRRRRTATRKEAA